MQNSKIFNNNIILGLSPPLRMINALVADPDCYVGGKLHSHPYYHVNYITEGSLKLTFNEKEYPVTGGQVFILPPNIPHTIYTEGGYSQIGMDIEVLEDQRGLFDALNNITAEELKISGNLNTNITFEKMRRLILNPSKFNILLAQSFAENILLCALADIGKTGKSAFTKKIENILKENNTSKLTLSELCAITGYSRVHLERQSKKEFGCGIIEYLNRLKTNRICSLLLNEHISIAQIAENEGFFDSGHLTVFFKKRMGITPSKYRKLNR